MAEIEINDLGSIGAVADVPAYQIPPEAFTTALNMRSRNQGLETINGWSRTLLGPASSAPMWAPHFALPYSTNSTIWWLSTSLTKAQAYDGTTYFDITRAVGGDYTATDTWQWNGTLLGGVPILNNGNDVPQYWPTPSGVTRLANLLNWPANLRARVVRAFGPYLMFINIVEGGVSFPHAIQWSHPADPGSVPSSYDITDNTKDTGRKDFSDVSAGVLLDMLPLGDTMFIYKEGSIWKGRYIGGRFIFDFGQSAWKPFTGLLATRCVAITGDGSKQVLATQDDICWHNGSDFQSVLNQRQKVRLFNEIDSDNFHTSFMFTNPFNNEVWFCYPGPGQSQPDRALIMNYGSGQVWPITEADGITFRNATIGGLEVPDDEAWDDGDDEWEVDTGPWSQLTRRRVVLCAPATGHFFDLDRGGSKDGVAFTGRLERTGLAVAGKKRTGEWINDFEVMKFLKRMWMKTQGPALSIRIGVQQLVDGPVEWGPVVSYNPATDTYVDMTPMRGRAVAISIEGGPTWRIDGYKPDIVPIGNF